MSFRVPVADVSVVDLTCELARETSYAAICAKWGDTAGQVKTATINGGTS